MRPLSTRKALVGLAICISGAAAPIAAQSVKDLMHLQAEPDKALPIVEEVCSGCHGMDGNSTVPNFPKIAGVDFKYLLTELKAYQKEHRRSEIMGPLAVDLSDQDMVNLAAYFAAQTPTPGEATEPELLGLGKKVYMDGNSDSGLPACEGCHGENGEGSGSTMRLAGQNPEYVVDQYRLYKEGKRTFSKKVMRIVMELATEDEIRAVAQYIATLSGQPSEE